MYSGVLFTVRLAQHCLTLGLPYLRFTTLNLHLSLGSWVSFLFPLFPANDLHACSNRGRLTARPSCPCLALQDEDVPQLSCERRVPVRVPLHVRTRRSRTADDGDESEGRPHHGGGHQAVQQVAQVDVLCVHAAIHVAIQVAVLRVHTYYRPAICAQPVLPLLLLRVRSRRCRRLHCVSDFTAVLREWRGKGRSTCLGAIAFDAKQVVKDRSRLRQTKTQNQENEDMPKEKKLIQQKQERKRDRQ